MMDERRVAIVDLDGTLADNQHREHLLPKGCGSTTEQWVAFNKACINDKPISALISMVNHLYYLMDYKVILLTGRGDAARYETEEWLKYHGVQFHQLWMRSEGDHRKSAEFKHDMLDRMAFAMIDDEDPHFEESALSGCRPNFPEHSLYIDDDPKCIVMVEEFFPELDYMQVRSKCAAVLKGKSQKGE